MHSFSALRSQVFPRSIGWWGTFNLIRFEGLNNAAMAPPLNQMCRRKGLAWGDSDQPDLYYEGLPI